MSLAAHLEELIARTDLPARLAADPVAFPRRYTDRADREIAAVVASSLAYGRVDLFRPVLQQLFARMDTAGGPAAYIASYEPDDALRPLIYRWSRGVDFVVLFAALRQLGPLDRHFRGDDAHQVLCNGVQALRDAAVQQAPACGVAANTFADLPRGLRYLLPSPVSGSACKRWCMFLRWMVRPDDGVDLGVWGHLHPRQLVVPVDTHVHRIARFVGLTQRQTANWRTAEDITRALSAIDPEDPVRFDFALAHLGISGGCLGHRDPEVCPSCPLDTICTAPAGRTGARRKAARR